MTRWLKLGRAAFCGGVLLLTGPVPLSAEFQINSFTTSSQDNPAVSHDSAGGFVVVWESFEQDGSNKGVFAQRFDSGGTALGGEFQINSFTTNVQLRPAVSHDSAGGFVVVWDSFAQDGELGGVFGQRFASGGMAQGGEFQINSFTTSFQASPAVSHDSAGGFVVVWYSYTQDGSSSGIFGQRFASSGVAQGGEFQINSFTPGNQYVPAVSHDSASGFVMVWTSRDQDGSYQGVFGQRFDSSGIPEGDEFQVNSFTYNTQWFPAVSHDSTGGFVVVWDSYTQDGSSFGIFGQRFDNSGMAQGGEFQINSFTTDSQRQPRVSHDSAGGFVVVWESKTQDGSEYGIFGQRFDSGGIPEGGEFPINSYTSLGQNYPAVSHDSAGGFVVVWESNGPDGSNFGIFGQRFFVARVVTGPSLSGASKVRRLEGPLFLAPP